MAEVLGPARDAAPVGHPDTRLPAWPADAAMYRDKATYRDEQRRKLRGSGGS